MDTHDAAAAKPSRGLGRTPTARPPRLRLDSVARVRRELVALYAEAKAGRRDVGDTSKLAHVLGLIGRLIEADELERRLEALEARDAAGGRR